MRQALNSIIDKPEWYRKVRITVGERAKNLH
jgi:hypothetical protein